MSTKLEKQSENKQQTDHYLGKMSIRNDNLKEKNIYFVE